MRVALLCGHADASVDGVAGYVRHLAKGLTELGVEPVLAAAEPVTDAVGITDGWGLGGTIAAGRAVRRLKADLVHVQYAPSQFDFRPTVGVLPAALPRGTALVTTFHEYRALPENGGTVPPSGVRGAIERIRPAHGGLLVPASDRVVVTNEAHRASLVARYGDRVHPELIPIGSNIVAPAPSSPSGRADVRRELGLSPDTVLLTVFGFVHPVKGVRYLIDALAQLRREGRGNLHALVVGGFTSLALPETEARAFEAELRGQIEAVGVSEHVTITGYLAEESVSRLLAASDVGVLPFTGGVTTKSGSLLALLGHGTPTVVTATGDGDPELVDGDTCVIASRVRDGEALAAALRRVLDDPGLRRRLARGGTQLAGGHSWAAIARQHLRLYEEVLR